MVEFSSLSDIDDTKVIVRKGMLLSIIKKALGRLARISTLARLLWAPPKLTVAGVCVSTTRPPKQTIKRETTKDGNSAKTARQRLDSCLLHKTCLLKETNNSLLLLQGMSWIPWFWFQLSTTTIIIIIKVGI